MKKIRIGNDIDMTITVTKDGVAESLEGKTLKLILRREYICIEVTEFFTVGNVIRFTFRGSEQKHAGAYFFTLYEMFEERQNVVDSAEAFALVPHSSMTGGEDIMNITTESVELSVDMVTGGVSDYRSLSNKPAINGVELYGDKTLEDLGIQPSGDYAQSADLAELSDVVDGISSELETVGRDVGILKRDFPNKVDKVEGKGLSTEDFTTDEKNKLQSLENYDDSQLKISIQTNANAIANKVDKVAGKGLSTEDFTTLLKQKLESLSNYDDTQVKADITRLSGRLDTLVGVSASAAIDTFNEIVSFLNGITDTSNLALMLSDMRKEIVQQIPTKTSSLTNDSNFVADPNYVHTDNNYTNEDKAIVGSVQGINTDQKNIVIEIDFPTASDLSAWFADPLNVARVRQGTIFRILNSEEPDFLAVFNNVARLFELKPIDKIITKTILEAHNSNPLAHPNLYNTIKSETEAAINKQFKDTSAQGSAVFYMRYISNQYVLSETKPTANENAPFALTGTTANTKVFAGTLQRAGFFSPKASYTESLYITGLQEQVRYTVRLVYSIKGIVIYDQSRTFTGANNETAKEIVFVIPSESTYAQRINFIAGDSFSKSVSVTKSTSGNNHTVNIASVPASGLYSLTQRYGGLIYATDIFDETQAKSQDVINSELYNSLITALTKNY